MRLTTLNMFMKQMMVHQMKTMTKKVMLKRRLLFLRDTLTNRLELQVD